MRTIRGKKEAKMGSVRHPSHTSGVYAIVCKVNKKPYIGRSNEIEHRFRQHRYQLNGGYHPNKWLQRDWNKYGEENFIFVILQETHLIAEGERHWIYYYRAKGALYNRADNLRQLL